MIQRGYLRLPAVYRVFRTATWLHVLIVLAAGAALRWPLLTLAPFITTDSRCCYYHYAANQILAGQPFDSDLHLPPGYSLFLAAILAVADGNTAAVMLVQHLMGLAAGLLVYFIGRRLLGPLVGLVAALLTVLDVELALYEHAVMSETLFALLLVCALAFVLLRLPGSLWLRVASFGLLTGVATLVRPTGLLMPVLVLFLPMLGPAGVAIEAAARRGWQRRLWHGSWRLRLVLVALVAAALLVVPMMVWNKRAHGVFALTTSLQRNMLYPIESAPSRLLTERGEGDPLLGQIKATISHHPTSPWTGPYGALLDRFHLSNEELDRLLMEVALDFVLADPMAYIIHILVRLQPFLTGSDATAAGLVRYGRQEYKIAGGPDELGVSGYDYAADLSAAHSFDQQTGFLRYSQYAWLLLALATFGVTLRFRRTVLLVVLIFTVAAVSVGTVGSGIPLRYRYPVTWAIYLLAAAGVAVLLDTFRATLATPAGRWRSLWSTSQPWPTIRREQLLVLVALLATAAVLIALAAGRSAFASHSHVARPLATLGGIEPPLSTQLDWLDWYLPSVQPIPRLVALSLPNQIAIDLVGVEGLDPDGQPDASLLLSLGHDLPGRVLKFVELGDGDNPTWDTTGWYRPMVVIRVGDGEHLSQHTDPRSKSLKLQIGDRLLVLIAAQGQPVTPEQFGVLRLHLGDGSVLSYPVEAEPLEATWRDTAAAPQSWLTEHAISPALVAIVQREEVRVVQADGAFSATPQLIEVSPEDRAAIRKWLHAETLERQGIQYVWVGNSRALKGEAATAVLDPTRLRPVLLQVQPGECPVRWRGLFVVATAAVATDVPLVPLTIPHPLADDEFQGALRFGDQVAGSLAPGSTTTVQLEVTNQSTQRWYGTCSSSTYPVGVAVEGRRSPEAPWVLIGEMLLTDDLPAGETARVRVEITAPSTAGRYELRARLVQRPDRVSLTTPATVNLVVSD